MSAPTESKSDRARRFYDATAAAADDFALMNYGFAPLGEAPAAPADDPERFCRALYAHVAGGAELRGRDVLEVSCGRGGGAAYLARTWQPASYIGLDFSEQNVRLAERRFGGIRGLAFGQGRAEALPFAAVSFDVVLSLEASHLYDDPARFLGEVARVLRRGGSFAYADLFWRDADPQAALEAAGLTIASAEDLTPHVLRALELDSERRERLVSTRIPEALREDFRDWAGVRGYRAYNRFASGEWVYRCFRARAPERRHG